MNKTVNNLICLMIYVFAGIPYVYLVLTVFTPQPVARASSLAVIPLALIGWSVQALVGKIKGIARKPAPDSADFSEDYFSAVQSVPALLVGIGAGVLLSAVVGRLFPVADKHALASFFPAFTLIITPLFVYLGAVVWFFPHNKLITLQSVISLFSLCFINFMMLIYFNAFGKESGYTPWILYIFGTLCLGCSAVFLNRYFISRSYSGNVKAAVNGEARNYSLKIMGLAGLTQAVLGVILFGCITGAVALAWGLIKTVVGITFVNSAAEAGENEVANGLSAISATGMPEWIEIIFIIFFIMAIIAGVLFVLFKTSGIIKEFIEKIVIFISNIIKFLFRAKEHEKKAAPAQNLSYKDTLENIRAKGVSGNRISTNVTYNGMLEHMATLRDDKERLAYAYVVLSDALRHKSYNIKRANTPSEISGKVYSTMPIESFDIITEAYEQVRYGGKDPENVRRLLDGICKIARVYIV